MISLPFLLSASSSEVKIYKGTSSYTSDILYTVRDGKVYKKHSNYTSDIVCTVRKDRIYKSTSNYTSDVLYTIRDGQVYKGTSTYRSDILMTIRDGQVYKGTSTYRSDILATNRNYDRWSIDTPAEHTLYINVTREGEVNGIHSVTAQSSADRLTLTHEAFNRQGFAMGAIAAAEFLIGKTGVFGMEDLMGA